MSVRGLGILQWFGLLGAALAWAGSQVVGYGITEAECGAGGSRLGIGNDVWQMTLMAAAGAVVVLAEAAAIAVWRATRGVEESEGPPSGRLHFFALAAMAANVIFLLIILLNGLASIYGVLCRQA